jgi:hypothetical protein
MTGRIILLTIVFSALCFLGYGQGNWELKSEKKGISIFTRTFPDSRFKAVKVECELEATLSIRALSGYTAPNRLYF